MQSTAHFGIYLLGNSRRFNKAEVYTSPQHKNTMIVAPFCFLLSFSVLVIHISRLNNFQAFIWRVRACARLVSGKTPRARAFLLPAKR